MRRIKTQLLHLVGLISLLYRILAVPSFPVLVLIIDVYELRILVRSVPMNGGETVAQRRTIPWSVVALLIYEDFNL